MNVTLTIPADAGAERAGSDRAPRQWRRCRGRQLWRASSIRSRRQRPQSDVRDPTRRRLRRTRRSIAKPMRARTRADGRRDSEPMARMRRRRGRARPGDSRAVRHQGRDRDAAADPVNRRDAGNRTLPTTARRRRPMQALPCRWGRRCLVAGGCRWREDDGAAVRDRVSDEIGKAGKVAAAAPSAKPATEDGANQFRSGPSLGAPRLRRGFCRVGWRSSRAADRHGSEGAAERWTGHATARPRWGDRCAGDRL